MQVTETASEGLRRDYRVVIGAADLEGRLSAKLETMKGQVQLKGFRPGKVPVSYLRKTYGKAIMGDIVQEAVNDTTQKTIADRALKPALTPKVDLKSDLEKVVTGGSDLEFEISVEVLPEFQVTEFKALSVTRPTAAVTDKELDEALARIAEQQRSFAAKDGPADKDDLVKIDFLGKIDGKPFDGGKGEDFPLVLGSGRFIPGFEDQLIGAKAGDRRDVTVTFPDEYGAPELAGKPALFEVSVKEVQAPQPVAVDDALAVTLGLENLAKLRETLEQQLKSDFGRASRAHAKRRLLDALDSTHSFDLPGGMVEAEFGAIWRAVEAEMKQTGKAPDDEGKTEDELKAEYRKIAERRVRLGLVLSEVARQNSLTVSQEELSRAMMTRARQFPGQERQVLEFYQRTPQALNELRAPLLEEKAVDFILELANVVDEQVSREDLFSDPDDLLEKRKA